MTDTLTSAKGTILIVDDIPDNLRVLSKTLTQAGYKVRSVTNGSMALRVAHSTAPDIILLDIKMPDLDGYEVCKLLKADPKTASIPVIFLSALDEVIDKVTAFEVGGVDYITKPFQFEEVLARVTNQLQLKLAQAEVERLNAELEQRVIQRTAQLEQEITKRQRIQEKLLYMALHDSLTELPNRTWLMQRLEQVFVRSQQHPQRLFAVLFLDCDRFKVVNDSLGHLVGDQLLVAIARRLESALNPGNTLARFGGDEFVILLEEISQPEDAIKMAIALQEEMKLSFHLEHHEIFINVSIGIVVGNGTHQQPDHLLRDADLALYQAKAKGKDCYQIFDPQMHAFALKRLQTETELRLGISNAEMVVYYQPIVSLTSRKIVGFEALVRWMHPERGLIPPDQFLEIAEDTGLILDIDLWVLEQACRQTQKWQEQFDLPLEISVNLSPRQFSQPQLGNQVARILARTQLHPSCLKLEITENALIENYQTAHLIIEQLRALKIQISLDDFGTGYSSLSYLHQFPVNSLKIDRSFVHNLETNSKNQQIIHSIIGLAHNLGISVIAEGIEHEQQLIYLQQASCDYGQGYFLTKPLDAQSIQQLLTNEQTSTLVNRKL